MDKRTRVITRCAACSALTVAILYIASVSPTGQVGIIAVSSLFTAAAVIETGYLPAIAVFIVSAVVGMLLLPNKHLPLLYIAFFGYYPVIKLFADRLKGPVLAWIIKLICFNLALTVVWFLLIGIIFSSPPAVHGLLVYAGGNTVFAAFDIGLGKLIGFYIGRISKSINRG